LNISDKVDTTGNAINETRQAEPAGPSTGWRESNWLALGELLVVALIFIADHRYLIPVSKTPFLLLLGWISLWVRKTR
jgi:hypothetical protein